MDYTAKDLPDYQKAVGGLIQRVNLLDESYMYINEQGWNKDLPYNKIASELLKLKLVGDVLLFIKDRKSIYFDLVVDSILA